MTAQIWMVPRSRNKLGRKWPWRSKPGCGGETGPGLATVLVGDNPASHVYVKSKHKACQEVGIQSFGHQLSAAHRQRSKSWYGAE